MNIGIIGVGNMGGALARRLRALGHTVALANSRGPQSLAAFATEIGAAAVSVAEAARDKDLIIVTIPQKNIPLLPAGLFADAAKSIVVDTGNYYPQQRDGRIELIESGVPDSRWVELQLGHPVVKAFNNIEAQHVSVSGKPAGTPGRIALPIAGDDELAKKIVGGLINELGFDVVDVGGLDESWRQQPGSPVYSKDYDVAGVRRALSEAQRERGPDWSAAPDRAVTGARIS